VKRKQAKKAEVILLVTGGQLIKKREPILSGISSYVVNRCHQFPAEKAVNASITNQPAEFIYHLPDCYLLN
jgi:hypothetical protein